MKTLNTRAAEWVRRNLEGQTVDAVQVTSALHAAGFVLADVPTVTVMLDELHRNGEIAHVGSNPPGIKAYLICNQWK
jgi:hypothetical protein